jgi:transposase
MLERWEGLTRFVADPRIPLDNNAAERALRGPVAGRKNHYGSRSLRGTHVAAIFYTLCETARLVGVDLHTYLLQVVYAAIAQPGAIRLPEDLLTQSMSTT